MARRLLAAGVTLPPEPDTPPEPQERYYVGDGQSDNKVYERGRAHVYAETYLTLDADRIARLLNLDESVKDDVCSGLHEAYPALVERVERLTAELAKLRRDYLVMRDLRDGHRERADLAEAPPVAPADLCAYCGGRSVECRQKRAEQSDYCCVDCTHEDAAPAVPQDDGPAEPLFTGTIQGRRSLMGMKHLDWVQIAPAYREDFPFDRLDIDDLVDVYPHGQRPAEGDGR